MTKEIVASMRGAPSTGPGTLMDSILVRKGKIWTKQPQEPKINKSKSCSFK